MKKTFLLLIAMPAFAQNSFCQNIFGLKAGLNLANQNITFTPPENAIPPPDRTKSLLGYQFGAFYKIKMNDHWRVATEANFSLVGSKRQYWTEQQILNPDGVTHYFNDKIGYIEVPVILQYSLKKLYLGTGPAIAFKVFSKMTNFEDRTYKTAFYKTLDASANILGGYQLAKKWDVNLRYSYGFLNIHEDNMYVSTKNRFLNMSLLYSLR